MQNKINPKMPDIKKKNPISHAVLNKIKSSEKKDEYSIDAGNIENVATSIKRRLENNEDIEQLFPDVELSMQILTSSIISPNDMMSRNLIYSSPDIIMPNGIDNHIMSVISKYIEKNYNLETKLGIILKEALFTKGAYIEAVIPEGTIDDVINIDKDGLSLEAFTTEIGRLPKDNYFLSNNIPTFSAEDFDVDEATKKHIGEDDITKGVSEEDLYIDITENTDLISASEMFKDYIADQVEQHFSDDDSLSTEDMQIMTSMFGGNRKRKVDESVEIVNLATFGNSEKESVDAPLVMKLPTESVIPVHITNDPSKHMGYFVLLDGAGSPITSESEFSFGSKSDVPEFMSNQTDNKQTIISKARTALKGITQKDPILDNLEGMYSKIVDKMIDKKLKDGLYGDIVEMKDNASLYRVMFTRALKGKKTKLLFVPSEMVAYYAFEYRDNGTGKSLLEKVSTLFSIRSILLFSNLMGNLKNSVTTTTVSADLDPKDPDPEKTMEKIISESMKSRQSQLPIGITKIDDLVDWSHKVGFRYNFKHPGLPEMTIDKSEEGASKIIPDTDLDEKIQEYIIMSFGLTKEMVMSGFDSEFATTVVAKNILLAKRVIQYQTQFNPMITDHIRKLLNNDAIIKDRIKRLVESNITDIRKVLKKHLDADEMEVNVIKKILRNKKKMVKYITDLYIKNITVSLPSPEMNEAENMKESLDSYIDSIETFLEHIMGDEAIPEEFVGELSGKLEDIRAVMKTVLVKKYMQDNNFIPEMSDFLTLDNEGKPMFDILEEFQVYVSTLTESLLPFLKTAKDKSDKTDEDIEKLEEEPEEEVPEGKTTEDDEWDEEEGGTPPEEDVDAGDEPVVDELEDAEATGDEPIEEEVTDDEDTAIPGEDENIVE